MEDTREVIDEALPLEPTSVSETPEESPPNLIDDNDSTKATAASENDKIVEETDTTETATTEKATTETATTEIATQPHGRKRKIADPESTDEQSANDSSDSKEIKLPPKQLLGKGKRARIPNKRYSDILLNPSPRANSNAELTIEDPRKSKSSLENGEIKDHSDTSSAGKENIESETGSVTDLREDSAFSSPSLKASRTNPSSNSSTPIAKKPKITVDLTNPNYRKPFQHGWKRELVYRTTSESAGRRNGDIYYYTPSGKKVRSMREVSENLKNKELTLDDFTFFKEPLGIDDPEKEIIRDAKFKSERPMKKASPKVSSTKVLSPKLASRSIDSPKVKNSPKLGGFKVKLPSKGNNKSKLKKKDGDAEELEMGTYPPNWTPPATKKNAKKTPAKIVSPPVRRKRGKQETPAPVSNEKTDDSRFMENYLQNLSYGYNTLLYVFQYLKVQDLLRASCVCTMWRDIASHPVLWRTVRMKNSQIHSFDGLADALEKHGTSHLDLRKMLLPANGDDMWPQFSRAIKKVDSLRKIELCRCPAIVVEQLALSNPKLEVINAITIKCDTMSLAPLMHLKNLQELRLKSTSGFTLTSDLTALSDLKQLKCLSLTSIKLLNNLNIGVIADLKYLESLDLGECTDFPKTFGIDILHRLDNLEKLRLEKGQGNCYTFEILDAVKNMPKLEQLELVNFDIKTGFDKALGACTNIKKLLIIPTYISQSATTNHMVLGGVLRLQKTLTHFVWGVTLELLRVTELFVDQCEEPDKKEKKERRASGNGDSIPVLKPVPLLHEGDKSDIPPAQDPPQVEILPLPNLQKLLLQNLPTTRVKILKIPFHATWRQSITDTVN